MFDPVGVLSRITNMMFVEAAPPPTQTPAAHSECSLKDHRCLPPPGTSTWCLHQVPPPGASTWYLHLVSPPGTSITLSNSFMHQAVRRLNSGVSLQDHQTAYVYVKYRRMVKQITLHQLLHEIF